jgi:pimeloyl-ACP methyl ester carboxylesterase
MHMPKLKIQKALTILFPSMIILLSIGYFTPIQGQTPNITKLSDLASFQAQVDFVDNLPSQKVKVGDIEIAYKQFGKNDSGKPIVLISGTSMTMDMWPPALLRELSANHRVIIFDNRGAGESTNGTKAFSIKQFANDTAGLLETLKIDRADILGFSLGSLVAQELALMRPDKIASLVLYGSSCGGKDSILPIPEVMQAFDALYNRSTSVPTQEAIDKVIALFFPTNWFRANPNYHTYIPLPNESVSLEISQKQLESYFDWDGTCNTISRIIEPTLVIVGTEDVYTPATNSIMIVNKIPASWLVQVRDAGHGLMYQHPDQFNRIVLTFLQTVN